MKSFIFALILATITSTKIFAQSCDIKIEVLPEQFMYGKVMPYDDDVKKIEVEFKDEVMEVLLPLDGHNYMISVLNENCQAYCKKVKRVRQLNSGDEKLVKNLIKAREQDIVAQIRQCNF